VLIRNKSGMLSGTPPLWYVSQQDVAVSPTNIISQFSYVVNLLIRAALPGRPPERKKWSEAEGLTV
jgi:hypothetical protein